MMSWSRDWASRHWTVQRLLRTSKGGYYATREGKGGTRLTALLRFWISPSLRRPLPTATPHAWAQQGGAVYDGKPAPAWEWAAEERRRR